MTRRTRGQKIATNIYRDAYGYAAIVKVKGIPHEKRFPPNADLLQMQQWQADERAYQLRCYADDTPVSTKPTRGSLAADVLTYLKRREGRDGYKADRSHLKAWTDRFGTRPRHTLRPHECQVLMASWRSAGRSEKTIRHRVRVFKELAHALDGKHRRTPLDGVKLPPLPRPSPKPVPWPIIRSVAESLRKGLTIQKRHGPKRTLAPATLQSAAAVGYARFLVRALTGQRADQIMRAEAGDVDLNARVWWVRPAKGGHPVPFPLTDDMINAWRLFIEAKAWGAWDWRSFAKLLRRHGWPKDIPPKNLRHTFAIDHLRAGTDIGDLQGLLGHANIQTTRTYYAPVLLSRLEATMKRRDLALVPKPADEQAS